MMPSEICASAEPEPKPSTARNATMRTMVMLSAPLRSSLGWRGLYTQVVVQLGHVGFELGVRNHVHHPAVLHHVVAVGDGGGEAEVLLHQENGEAFLLEPAERGADLLDDDRRQ